MFKYFTLKRLWQYMWLLLSHLPMRGHYRWFFLKKDIPANQVWAGNPAHYIKDRVVE